MPQSYITRRPCLPRQGATLSYVWQTPQALFVADVGSNQKNLICSKVKIEELLLNL